MDDSDCTQTSELYAAPAWVSSEQLLSTLSYGDAIDVLEQTIVSGFDPEEDGVRTRHEGPAGTLLQMPSASEAWCGTKLITLRDAKNVEGLPAIQGIYILFEGQSLRPVALVEGAGLTALRTPAMTLLAIKHLAHSDSGRVALFGTGVQARAHIQALKAAYRPEHIDVIGRDPGRVKELVTEIRAAGFSSSASNPEIVAEADVILCCTASPDPLFDGALVQDHAFVAAIGAHDQHSREVDSVLVQRSTVIVESHNSARREAGDLIIPYETGELDWSQLITIKDVISDKHVVDFNRPRLFKGTGMPWQDLAVAASAYMRTFKSVLS